MSSGSGQRTLCRSSTRAVGRREAAAFEVCPRFMPWLDVQRSHEQDWSGFARFGAELTELSMRTKVHQLVPFRLILCFEPIRSLQRLTVPDLAL
jgi:hypothetical protein